MLAVFFRTIKDKYLSLLVYITATVVFLEMYVALFPTFGNLAQDKISTLLDSYPKEIWTVIGLDPSMLNFTKIEVFVSSEQYSFIWPIIVIIFAISLANWMIAAEVEKGTIEQVISLPVSRLGLFLGRYLAGATMLAVFTFTTIYSLVPLAAIHKISLAGVDSLPLAVSGFCFALAVYSFAVFSSSLFSEKSKASFLSAGVILLSYIGNIIGGLNKDFLNLKYFSVFHYFGGGANLVKAEYVDNYLVFYLGIALVFTLFSAIRFVRRDLSV